jgi:hypothetical protein
MFTETSRLHFLARKKILLKGNTQQKQGYSAHGMITGRVSDATYESYQLHLCLVTMRS